MSSIMSADMPHIPIAQATLHHNVTLCLRINSFKPRHTLCKHQDLNLCVRTVCFDIRMYMWCMLAPTACMKRSMRSSTAGLALLC